MKENKYGFSLKKAEIFDRRNYSESSPEIVHRITKRIEEGIEKTIDIEEKNLFGNKSSNCFE